MSDARILVRALRDPASVLALDDAGWTALLTIAHAERLRATLAHRVEGLPIPARVADILQSARSAADEARVRALWEVEMARRALAPLSVPVVLLKGSAFVAAGLQAGQGRLVGDLDLLVPRDRLDAVEAALLAAGWEWLKSDPYDDAYYRRWMHELPPMIHRERDAMIDVHHTILPLTAKPKPDPAAMIAGSVGIAEGLRVLSPEDMVIHAAAHLLADGDMSGGLRNLWDIHCLLEEFEMPGLIDRARRHGLEKSVRRALQLSHRLFQTTNRHPELVSPLVTDVPGSISQPELTSQDEEWMLKQVQHDGDWFDRFFATRLLARDGWGRETRKGVRFWFYVRSHLIRMPLPMLLRHLWIKWRRAKG